MNTPIDNRKLDSQEDFEISLLELYSLIFKNKISIGLITVFFSLSSVFYSLSLDKYYSASLLMMPAENSAQPQGMTGLLSGFVSGQSVFGGTNNNKEALAILQSRIFVESFISREELMPKLFPKDFDENTTSWNSDEIPTLKDGYQLITDSLKINMDDTLIRITLVIHDPELAADIVNSMTKAVNNHIRQESIEESQRSIFFLETEINKTNLATSIAMLYRLIEQQTQTIMMANTREDYAFKVIDPARAPISPAGPNRRVIVIISTLIGFIVSIFITLVINLVKSRRV
jgi:LPS O-antigen subunit length determinant protein (WzzB/FepE family)